MIMTQLRAESMIGRKYGWIRSLPVFNDKHLALAEHVPLPRSINHYELQPLVWDQGKQGSCTANGGAAAACWARKVAGQPFMMPSRSFLYFNERAIMGTTAIDSGATVSDSVAAMTNWGIVPDSLCPYDGNHLMTTRASDEVYTEAARHKVLTSGYINQDLYTLQQALAQGWCFVFGFSVYQNFESDGVAQTGLMEMPQGLPLGGHCVFAVGYNSLNYLMCRNSWSESWGDPDFPGYFWMPPAYYTNPQLASDFRVVKTMMP